MDWRRVDNWATLAVVVSVTCVGSRAADAPTLVITGDRNREVVHATLAWTDADQGAGVRGVHDFRPGQAMYFPLHPSRQVSVYMDGVNIDLDVAFIRSGRIVEVRHAVACPVETTATPCPVITSPGTVDAVLELPHTPRHTLLDEATVTTYALSTK